MELHQILDAETPDIAEVSRTKLKINVRMDTYKHEGKLEVNEKYCCMSREAFLCLRSLERS
jgi:hypothetical protein